MNTKLSYFLDWPVLARQAKWSVTRLAKLCCVTERTLRRHFLKQMGQTPKNWLDEQRQKLAVELLRDGSSVKETAAQLGYGCSETFSREFKKQCGKCPVEMSPLTTIKPLTPPNVRKSHEMSDFVGSFPLKPSRTVV